MKRKLGYKSLLLVASIVMALSTTGTAWAVGACNSAGCWAMRIMSIKTVSTDAKVFVTFETDTIDPLKDGGSFTGCRVWLTPMQANHPALLVTAGSLGSDKMLAQLLTAFALEQPVGLGVTPSNVLAGDGVPYCAIQNLYFYRPDCNSTTAVCQ